MRELECQTFHSELCEDEYLVIFNELDTYTLRTAVSCYYYANNSMQDHRAVEHRMQSNLLPLLRPLASADFRWCYLFPFKRF